MDSYSGTSVCEFVLDHGYQVDFLRAALISFLLVLLSFEAGDSGDQGDLNIEMSERFILVLAILSEKFDFLLVLLFPDSTNVSSHLYRTGLYLHFIWLPYEVRRRLAAD